VVGEFDGAAVPNGGAAIGDVITTTFDAVGDVQFEGRTLSQMLPWHLNVN